MAIFGDDTEFSIYGSVDNSYNGISNVTPASSGTAESISAYVVSFSTNTAKAKCILLDASDDSVVGVTEELDFSWTTTPTWRTFNFTTGVQISSSKNYHIVLFSENADWNNNLMIATSGQSGYRCYKGGLSYPTVPDPTPSLSVYGTDDSASIYCTYTANTQINIGDAWKSVDGMKINIGDSWKAVDGMQINIGDSWKSVSL